MFASRALWLAAGLCGAIAQSNLTSAPCVLRQDCEDPSAVCAGGTCSACGSLDEESCGSPCIWYNNSCTRDLLSFDIKLDQKPPYLLILLETLVKVSVMVIVFPVKRQPRLGIMDYCLQLAVFGCGLITCVKDVLTILKLYETQSLSVGFLAGVCVVLVTSSNTVAALAVKAQVETYVYSCNALGGEKSIYNRYGPIFLANYYFLQVVYYVPMQLGSRAMNEAIGKCCCIICMIPAIMVLTKKLEVPVCRLVLKLHSDKLDILHPIYEQTANPRKAMDAMEGLLMQLANPVDISNLYISPLLGTVIMSFSAIFLAHYFVSPDGDRNADASVWSAFMLAAGERSYSTYFLTITTALQRGADKAVLTAGSILNRLM